MCFLLQVHFSSLYKCSIALYNVFAINLDSIICFVFLSKCGVEWKWPHYLPVCKENSLSLKGALLTALEIEIPVQREEAQHRQANPACPSLLSLKWWMSCTSLTCPGLVGSAGRVCSPTLHLSPCLKHCQVKDFTKSREIKIHFVQSGLPLF